jgi:imidazolonepropionase-like amidohydrolase
MRISSFIAAALALAPLAGQTPKGGAEQAPAALYVQVGRAWLSPTTAVSDAWLVVEGGVLKAIQPKAGFTPPPEADVVELPEGWALPTFIHAGLRGVVNGEDPEEGVTPTAIAADAYDPYEPKKELAAHGVGRAFIGTGYARLVPGQGSVVRLNPVDPSAAAPLRRAALRLNFRDEVRTTPDVWEPPDVPTAERPLPPSTVQGPKTLAGAVARARALFDAAAAWRAAPRPFAEGEVDLRPFADALAGTLRVRVAADRRGEIRAAIELARTYGLKLVVEGGAEAWRLAPELASVKASVVLRVSRTAPAAPTALPAFDDFDGEGHPDAPAVLKAAGVPVALVPPRGAPEHDVWFYATRALRNDGSFAADDVLASVTWGAAEILGLDGARDNPTGKTAEFVVYAGSPFETSARPYLVVAEGRVAAREKTRDVIAITAGRVHTCEGETLRDATILVEGGKIRSIGRRVAVPPGARRVRADVVVPGFVDAGTQLGVRQYVLGGDDLLSAGPLQAGGLDTPLSKWFDPRMPAVRGAAAAGVTTAALAPTGGRLVSGVVSTVKTSGRDGTVLKPASAVVFDLAGAPTGAALKRQLEQTLEGGKKYFDSWNAYEKALKEWEAKGKTSAPAAERKVLAAPAVAKVRDPIGGVWEGTLTAKALPRPIPFRLDLKADGKAVTGVATSSAFPNEERRFAGAFVDGVLQVDYSEKGFSASFKLIVGRDVLTGSGVSKMLGEGTLEARRIERPADADEAKTTSRPATDSKPSEKGEDAKKDEAKKDDDGRPKPPRRDVGMEALRELFADRGAAYVFVPGEKHAEVVLEVFRAKYDLRTVICSTADFGLMLDRYKAAGALFSTTVPSADDAQGVAFSPAETAWRARLGVILRSGPGGDSRTLYALAEAAVRDGVDPDDALRMITRQPARFLGVLDRVGSLDRGKDADLVFLSGEPFEAGTQVVRTMIDGAFVGEGEAR